MTTQIITWKGKELKGSVVADHGSWVRWEGVESEIIRCGTHKLSLTKAQHQAAIVPGQTVTRYDRNRHQEAADAYRW